MMYCNPLFSRLKAEKQEWILSKATKEFASLGYRAANINTIAEKCGISVGSLYKYFGTKENLFLSACHQMADILKSGLELVDKTEGGFLKKVEKIIRLIQDYSRRYPDIIHLYNEVTTQGNSELAAKLSGDMESVSAELYSRYISEAMDRGEISADLDVRMAAFCLDNLFMTLQFSYSVEFYKERMKVYVAPDILDDDEKVLQGTMDFIRNAFGMSES